MKRIHRVSLILFIFLALVVVMVHPLLVRAADPDPGPLNQILGFFLATLKVLIQICLTLALVVFGWGVVKLITHAGNPQKIEEAKKTLLWGIIGIFVLASLYGIITFIQEYTGITNSKPAIEIPKFVT